MEQLPDVLSNRVDPTFEAILLKKGWRFEKSSGKWIKYIGGCKLKFSYAKALEFEKLSF